LFRPCAASTPHNETKGYQQQKKKKAANKKQKKEEQGIGKAPKSLAMKQRKIQSPGRTVNDDANDRGFQDDAY
jgi:hypothetical protein